MGLPTVGPRSTPGQQDSTPGTLWDSDAYPSTRRSGSGAPRDRTPRDCEKQASRDNSDRPVDRNAAPPREAEGLERAEDREWDAQEAQAGIRVGRQEEGSRASGSRDPSIADDPPALVDVVRPRPGGLQA